MLELLKNRRSIRKYKEEKIDKATLDKILKCALLSPSSKNKQPIEFIVIEDRKTILELETCKNIGTLALKTAPMAIVIIGDSKKSDVWVEDASIVATIIQLEAEKLDLGSCWIQIRKRQGDNEDSEVLVRNILNIPDNYGVLAVLSLGYKNEQKKPYNEEDINFEKVHYNKFN